MRTNLSLFEALCRRLDAVDAWMAGSTADWLDNPTVSALATAVRTTSVELAYATETVRLERVRQLRAAILSRPVEERREALCRLVGQGRLAASVAISRYREIMGVAS